MRKWLLLIIIGFSVTTFAQEVSKIAIVNMNSLFQNIAQKTNISIKLENEFKIRASELQHIEKDLQSKMQRLQRSNNSIMKEDERNKLEKEIILQRQTFSKKAQSFEQDHQRRSGEERDKLITYIQSAVKKIAIEEGIDMVIDSNSVIFNSKDIKDITSNVLKQVK